MQKRIETTLSKYGSSANFLTVLNPRVQIQVASNLERAFMGDSPTLTTVKYAYNQEVLESWIMAQIENLNDFCGVKEKMDILPMEELARMIIVDYHFLKVSELMLFFHRFKAGRYGEFYGVVDPQKVMSGLMHFVKDRIQEIHRYEANRKDADMKAKREEWAKTGVSRQEYERMKQEQTETI